MIPRNLDDFTGPYVESNDERNYVNCPVCGSAGRNTYVNMKTGRWFCHAANHGAGGVVGVIEDTETARSNILQMINERTGQERAHVWPEKYLPRWRRLSSMALRYLHQRGLTDRTIAKLALAEMEDTPRILIPYYGSYGQITHWTGRKFIDTILGPKYLSAPGAAPVYMLPSWEPVPVAVLVEGPFDAIMVYQHMSLPAIALGGKTASKQTVADVLDLVTSTAIIMLDGDAFASSLKLYSQLYSRLACSIVQLNENQDPGGMSKEEMLFHLDCWCNNEKED